MSKELAHEAPLHLLLQVHEVFWLPTVASLPMLVQIKLAVRAAELC